MMGGQSRKSEPVNLEMAAAHEPKIQLVDANYRAVPSEVLLGISWI